MSNQCESSSDCFDLFNDTVVRFCYEEAVFSDEVFFCDCSAWYGWQGDNCDEESFQLHWFRFILITTAIVSLGSITILSTVLIRLLRIILVRRKKNILHEKRTPIGTYKFLLTAMCFLFSSTFFFINAVFQIPSLFDSTRFVIVSYRAPEFEDITVPNGDYISYFILFGASSLMFGILLLVLSWFDILKQSSTFFPEAFGRKERILTTILKTSVVFYVSLSIFSVVLKTAIIASFLLAVTVIMTGVLFIYATKSFLSKLSEYLEDHTVKDVFSTIRKAYKDTVICLLLSSVSIFLYFGLLFVISERLTVGGFNFIGFVKDIAIFTGLYLSISIGLFLHKTTSNISGFMSGKTPVKNKGYSNNSSFKGQLRSNTIESLNNES